MTGEFGFEDFDMVFDFGGEIELFGWGFINAASIHSGKLQEI